MPANKIKATAIEEDAEPATRVLRQFRVVFNAVKTHFRQVERDAGIGGAQLWALATIKQQPDIGVGELARALDIHQSTASNLIRALVERELVEASRHSADRRAVTLRILPAGSRILRKAPAPFTGVLPDALSELDPKTLARLEKDLAKLIAVLAADEAGANVLLSEL